jgi:ABC-2 type transport system permease protein
MNPRTVMTTLVRREFWEHRGLWAAPLITAGMLVLLTFFTGGRAGGMRISVDGKEAQFLTALSGPAQEKFFGVFIGALLVPQLIVALIVLFFYLLDSLYSERKDRSILFWKSLPVSDSMTVASKAIVALFAVPLMVWALSVLVSVLCTAALAFKVSGTPFAALATWHTGTWMAIQGLLLVNVLLAALWYAPVAAYLLLVSAFARRAVFIWAVMPAAVLTLVEHNTFGTDRVGAFLIYRLGGFFDAMGMGVSGNRNTPPSIQAGVAEVEQIYDKLNALPLLLNIDLWLGLAAAVAMLYGAVRLRRWRDDT